MRRREATAPALDHVETAPSHVIADAAADARSIYRATDRARRTHEDGSLHRIAASASAEGDKPCPRKPPSLSVRSPALRGRGAKRPSSDVGTASIRDASRLNATATRRANSDRGRISGPATWNVP